MPPGRLKRDVVTLFAKEYAKTGNLVKASLAAGITPEHGEKLLEQPIAKKAIARNCIPTEFYKQIKSDSIEALMTVRKICMQEISKPYVKLKDEDGKSLSQPQQTNEDKMVTIQFVNALTKITETLERITNPDAIAPKFNLAIFAQNNANRES